MVVHIYRCACNSTIHHYLTSKWHLQRQHESRLKKQQKINSLELLLVGYWCIKLASNMAFASPRPKIYERSGKKTGSTENLLCTGHPKKTTERMEHYLVHESLSNQRKPFCEIANATSPIISTSTVPNVLAWKGYHCRVAKKVSYLTRAHKWARLVWAQICKAYTPRIWRKKIWSDEC